MTDLPEINLAQSAVRPTVAFAPGQMVDLEIAALAPTPLVSLSPAGALGEIVFTPAAPPLVTLVQQAENQPQEIELALSLTAGPTITLNAAYANGLDLSAEPVQIALQAFMAGEPGPAGETPQISISAHATSADQQPSVTAGGTPLSPTFDIGIPSGVVFNVDEFVAQTSGQQIRTYVTAASVSTKVLINGLRQQGTAFTVSGNQVILPDTLEVEAGDLVQIEY